MKSLVVLAIDMGDARIGLARGSTIARLPSPLETIPHNEVAADVLQRIVSREGIERIVVGVPRNLDGAETPQSKKIRKQAEQLTATLDIPIQFVDESMSSRRAQEYLMQHPNAVAEEDSIAACFILEEYFDTIGSV